jgi:hypothetical protein
MILRARTVTMRMRILNVFSKPLCVSICHVMTLCMPGVTRDKSDEEADKEEDRGRGGWIGG